VSNYEEAIMKIEGMSADEGKNTMADRGCDDHG
jgi:hypothetical protein